MTGWTSSPGSGARDAVHEGLLGDEYVQVERSGGRDFRQHPIAAGRRPANPRDAPVALVSLVTHSRAGAVAFDAVLGLNGAV
eukprot:scaffold274213_cov40-Prasinocladus_malaysianus.AAC.1